MLSTALMISISLEAQYSIKGEKKQPGIQIENIDKNVRPQDDFYKFVNGKWLENNSIPDDETSWGSFNQLRKATNVNSLLILKKASKSDAYANGTDQRKALDLFQSIMDTESRNRAGAKPLQVYLQRLKNITNFSDLQGFMVEMEPYGGVGFFGFGVGAGLKNSNINVGFIGPSRLGLPDREYYMAKDDDSKEIRKNYILHVTRMFEFVGYDNKTASDKAARVLAYETKLATHRLTKEEGRDIRQMNNPMTIKELNSLVGIIDWEDYFKPFGITSKDTIIVTQPVYMNSLNILVKQDGIDEAKNYVEWNMINDAANLLTEEMDKANWDFYSKSLRGSVSQKPIDERALSQLNWTMGEALGKLYVDEYFPAEAKENAEMMVDNVIEAYKARILALDWMSKVTKIKAIEKLDKMTVKVGYPNKWKDYSDLEVKSVANGGSYFQNALNVSKWSYMDDLKKLNKEVDKSEWGMAPQVVNAYYNPQYNEIVFPAAILQPPFYDYKADEAVNYGGIGAVIGHEISHGFDDQGARFDADGNFNNWWTEEDSKNFEERGKKLIAQFDAIEVKPGMNINGAYTLGENIGDLGGVNAAYDGLQLYFSKNKKPGDIDGYSAEQRFFMSWATVWRTLMRDEAMETQIKTNVHSPGEYRGYVPLKNVDGFYEAFKVKKSDKMYLAPKDRVNIW